MFEHLRFVATYFRCGATVLQKNVCCEVVSEDVGCNSDCYN